MKTSWLDLNIEKLIKRQIFVISNKDSNFLSLTWQSLFHTLSRGIKRYDEDDACNAKSKMTRWELLSNTWWATAIDQLSTENCESYINISKSQAKNNPRKSPSTQQFVWFWKLDGYSELQIQIELIIELYLSLLIACLKFHNLTICVRVHSSHPFETRFFAHQLWLSFIIYTNFLQSTAILGNPILLCSKVCGKISPETPYRLMWWNSCS